MKEKITIMIGFVMTMIGGSSMDNDSLVIPLIMAAAGATILLIEGRRNGDTI